MSKITCEAGEGRCRVWLEKKELDDGLVLVLGGGESTHIGGIIYQEPGMEPAMIELEGHRDPDVMLPIAEAASRKYRKPVVVTGGIHIDDATKDEIQQIIKNCEELTRCI